MGLCRDKAQMQSKMLLGGWGTDTFFVPAVALTSEFGALSCCVWLEKS